MFLSLLKRQALNALNVIVNHTKKKRVFYGCSNYPECDFVSWNEPVNERCPQCGGILFKKKGKKPKLYCATEGCGFEKEFVEKDGE